MLKDIILLGLGAIFGLGSAMSSVAAPAYFPSAPAWVWHWLFWGGVCLMVLMVVDAIFLLTWRPQFTTALLINVGAALIAAGLISQFTKTASHEALKPKFDLTANEGVLVPANEPMPPIPTACTAPIPADATMLFFGTNGDGCYAGPHRRSLQARQSAS